MILDVDGRPNIPVWTPGRVRRAVLLWNLHLTDPVYFTESKPVSTESDSIPPLGSVTLDGEYPVYASSLNPAVTVPLQVTAGGESVQPSPAQVADQLALLGLMKDSTGQAIDTTMGTVNTSVTGLPAMLQPGLSSIAAVRQGSGSITVHTFAANSRLWALHLSFAAVTDGTFASGITNLFAELSTGSGLALTVTELAVSSTSQAVNGDSDLAFSNGVPIASGDTLVLNVNNGTTYTGAVMRASCTALYSSP